MTTPSTAQRAAMPVSSGRPSSTNPIVRPRAAASARTAAPAAFRTDSASARSRLPRPTTATRRARTPSPGCVCSTVTWPAAPRISFALTSREIAPSRALSSSAAAPSSTIGLVAATASRSTLAEAAGAADVEIFRHGLAWPGDENPARVSYGPHDGCAVRRIQRVNCPTCGGRLPEGARFCPTCGRPLAGELGGVEERKLATVLFADMAGSTELAMRLDPEHLRALLGDVYSELSQAAGAFGGTVEKFIGDAVMAVFGVPQAHEDDPERAVRAALTMVSRAASVGRRHGVEVVLRVGIYTGVVVTGASPGRDFLVTGEIVNLAARLQQAAEPGEVLIGEPTFRALEAIVRTTQPRSLVVKGRTGPVLAHAVERLAPATAS